MTADLETIWASFQMQVAAHRPTEHGASVAASGASVPVTVLSGFLGAGKSHLLVRLLSQPPEGTTIQAIVNDVGALPFDPGVIDATDDVRIELTNGCSCCERTADLRGTLQELAGRPGTGLIVLEASGAADPSSLAQVIEATDGVHLDRIVTVVTVEDALDQLDRPIHPVHRRQIEVANSVVISRCDLVDAETSAAARSRLGEFAPGRPITCSSLDEPAVHALLPAAPRGAAPRPVGDQLAHDDLIVETFTPRSDPTTATFEATVGALRPELVRAKGRVTLDGRPCVVQVTPATTQILRTADGPQGLTVIATAPEPAAKLARLFGSTSSGPT